MAEVFSATQGFVVSTPNPAPDIGAAEFTPVVPLTIPLNVANAQHGHVAHRPNTAPDIGAVEGDLPTALVQNYQFGIAAAEMLALAGTASLAGIVYPTLVIVSAQTAPEFASYRIGDKPIGQWTVGTDYVAATANQSNYVQLQQNIQVFTVVSAQQGHTVVAPTQNETSQTVGVANATQGETADPVVFTQAHTLVSVSAETGNTVTAPALTQPSTNLGVVSPNTMGTEVAAPDLTVLNQALGVAVAEVGYTVAAPNLFLIPNVPTPAERTFIPAAEDRTFTPTAETRTFALAA